MKKISPSERLKIILSELKTNKNALSKTLGYNNNVGLANIENGKYNFSTNLANRIIDKFPQFNYDWLRTGEGEMLQTIYPTHLKSLAPNDKIGSNDIRKRLLFFLNYLKIGQFKFENNVGLSRGFMNKMRDNMRIDTLNKIIKAYPELNKEWLLTGNGEMLINKHINNSKATVSGNNNIVTQGNVIGSNVIGNNITNGNVTVGKSSQVHENTGTSKPVYLYDVSAAAGYGSFDIMISQERVVGEYTVPAFKGVDWMIYVKGSSMYPKYSSGDIVACRVLSESKFIQWGKVYVVATKEQGLLVKRLEQSEKENCLLAVSDNEAYRPFDIPMDEVTGIALVVGVIRME
jgi:phage repressor protein C with HTH and peptisase S24 domain/DNA-binding XRE family transcriptional regulator